MEAPVRRALLQSGYDQVSGSFMYALLTRRFMKLARARVK